MKQPFIEFLFSFQTANVAYCRRKIQLSGFSAYPDGSPSQLIRIIGVILYYKNDVKSRSQLMTRLKRL